MTVDSTLPYDHHDVQVNLAKAGLIVAGGEIELTEYPTGYLRRSNSQRRHYKISSAQRAICHLVAGPKLKGLYEKAVDFFAVCPELVCRPLAFWQNAGGLDQLVLEHVTGSSLDSMVEKSDCDGPGWMNFVQQAQAILKKTRQPSDKTALEKEFVHLIDSVSTLPGVSRLDLTILREGALPAVLEGVLTEKLFTQWSNGDFCGRNLLVDARGHIRLIDYEFSSQTHFSGTDWLRLRNFSVLPSELNPDLIFQITEMPKPWEEVWFWLHQLSLLTDAAPDALLTRHRSETVAHAFSAIAKITRANATRAPISLFIDSLAAYQDENQRLLKERTVWATSLENELRQSLDVLTRRNKLADERLEWAKSLEKELVHTKQEYEKLSGTVTEHQMALLDARRDMAVKDAASGMAGGLALDAQLRAVALETEVNRLKAALADAQIHIDHLLTQTRDLNVRIESTRPYLYAIDHSSHVHAHGGLLKLSGWLAGISEAGSLVRLRIGSHSIFDCQTGVARPDVAAVHPTVPGAAVSGFNVETYIPAGFHIGTLEHCQLGASNWTPFHTLSIQAEVGPLFAHLDTDPPSAASNSHWQLRGWCFHPQYEVAEVSIQFGPYQCILNYGASRPDVGLAFPGSPTAPYCGFAGRLLLGPGQGPVVVTVKLSNGSLLRQNLIQELKIEDSALLQATQAARNARASRIKLIPCDEPTVSIIIPIYNQLDLTLSCLSSIGRHAGQTTFEAIVIDDNSDPMVAQTLSLVGGLQLFSNEVNRGFVFNCNYGATKARGNFVLFLNNDTEVSPGWLDAMIMVFVQRPNAGAVGAKLIYPDGRLQEAGGIIGDEGIGWNFGRGDDPDRPEYNYLRQVDYCSGACLLLPRQLFSELGGFDQRYQPAYYEDTDLAFAVRARGKEVYYQPAARIVHFEGVSSGTDLRTGIKRYQVINRAKFSAKWAEVLQNMNADPSFIDVTRDRYARGRILVLDACALTPDADSGSLRMFNLLLVLAGSGAKVTFVATNLQSYEPFSTKLQDEGIEHLSSPHVSNLSDYLEKNAYSFDAIILSRKSVASEYIDIVRRTAPNALIVFDTVDLMFLRLERQAEHERSESLRLAAAESKKVELHLCKNADLVFVVSPVEAELLAREILAEKIALVSNIHATFPTSSTFSERKGVMFVGGFQHPPNVDAVEYFLDEIMPLVVSRLPDFELHIIGSNLPEALRMRESRQIFVHGYVPDLNEFYGRVKLTIAPLRYGAGVKGKVNQSMAHGVPVVATSIATEGMHLTNLENVMIGDTPHTFADALCRIYTDPDLWSRVAARGRENIEEHFSFTAVERNLMGALVKQRTGLFDLGRPLPKREVPYCNLNETLDFGLPGTGREFLDVGWSEPAKDFRWTVGFKATLRFRFRPGTNPGSLKLILFPFLVPGRVDQQRLQITIPAGIKPEWIEMNKGSPSEFVFTLPTGISSSGDLTVQFTFPDACIPHELGISNDLRRLAFAFMQLTFS